MGISKKGFFFTTIAIFLSVVMVLAYNVYVNKGADENPELVDLRISSTNYLIEDIGNDVKNAIFIIGFRSLISLEDYLMENNAGAAGPSFLDDLPIGSLDAAFEESFIYGTIDSQVMSIMKNNTLINWTKKMQNLTDKIGVVLNFTINDVAIAQSSPWFVDIKVDMDINAWDKKNISWWSVNKIYTGQINITGFTDPLYLVNADGDVNSTITVTPIDPAASTTDLRDYMLDTYYNFSALAPSYLMRFENDLSSSTNGIESLVDADELAAAGKTTYSRSAVDYLYWDASGPSSCLIAGLDITYPLFRLDDAGPNHINFYNTACA